MGRTQHGNNNAYCHDSELSWVDWSFPPRERSFLEFARALFRLRHQNPVLRRRGFFAGRPVSHDGEKDVTWLRPDGREMAHADWAVPDAHVLGMLVHGEASDERDERGQPMTGDWLLLCMNGGAVPRAFTLPRLRAPGVWREVVNTARPERPEPVGDAVHLIAYSLVLLRWDPQAP
jgi:glycogen operon protein